MLPASPNRALTHHAMAWGVIVSLILWHGKASSAALSLFLSICLRVYMCVWMSYMLTSSRLSSLWASLSLLWFWISVFRSKRIKSHFLPHYLERRKSAELEVWICYGHICFPHDSPSPCLLACALCPCNPPFASKSICGTSQWCMCLLRVNKTYVWLEIRLHLCMTLCTFQPLEVRGHIKENHNLLLHSLTIALVCPRLTFTVLLWSCATFTHCFQS